MDTNYLEEAFKRLSLLEDDFDISVDVDKVDELRSFIEDDVDEIPEEEIVDVNAEDESELQDNYIGKVILECECCHSRVYKDIDDVVIDDESGLANISEACPVCNNELGYTVIGKIEPFDSNKEIKPEDNDSEIEVEDEAELPADDVEVEDEVEESLANRVSRKHLTESASETEVDDKINELINNSTVSQLKGILEKNNIDSWVLGYDDSELEPEDFYDVFFNDLTDEELNRVLGIPSAGPEIVKEDFEKPNNLDLDPDTSVEDDVKLETPHENPITEDPSILNIKEGLDKDDEDEEPLDECGDNKLTEAVNNVTVDTDDTHLDISSDDTGKVTVTSEPLVNEEVDIAADIVDEPLDTEGGDEEIVPLDSEDEIDIENNTGEEEADLGEFDEESPKVSDDDEFEEFDIEDFDEDSFNEMGESYMRKVYSNIKNYKATKINEDKNSIIIEGLITFKSGAQRGTKFVFENATVSKRGKLVLEGYNQTFTDKKNSFILRGTVDNKKYIPERFIYNYNVKQLNESTNSDEVVRVFGRIKRK